MEKEHSAAARELALKYLARKDKTQSEIRSYLMSKNQPNDAIDDVLSALSEAGIVDDRKFCENYISECIRKRKGRRLIRAELSAKGIDRELAGEMLGTLLSQDVERENAYAEALKLTRSGEGSADPERVMRRLAYLGYDADIIYGLIEQLRRDTAEYREKHE